MPLTIPSTSTFWQQEDPVTGLEFPRLVERRDLFTEKTYRILEGYVQCLPNFCVSSLDLNPRERFFLDAILEDRSLWDFSSSAILSSLRSKLNILLAKLNDSSNSAVITPASDLLSTFRTSISTS